ncbi:hypothetical protein NXH76_13585 [Blautia schinkii]|nr:hypothetical protein [Blautia schinkii]
MFQIKLAGIIIRIHNLYDYVKWLCDDFRVADKLPFEMEISYTEKELLLEHELLSGFSFGYCESNIIYRKICLEMLYHRSMVVHAAVISCEREGFAFAARSGTGKSTHVVLWRQAFGDKVEIINGDKPLLSFDKEKEEFIAYGTPWCGKEGWGVNKSVPLKAICFLERETDNHIREAEPKETLERLFSQVLIPVSDDLLQIELDLIDLMMKKVSFYILSCNASQDAARVARLALQSKD